MVGAAARGRSSSRRGSGDLARALPRGWILAAFHPDRLQPGAPLPELLGASLARLGVHPLDLLGYLGPACLNGSTVRSGGLGGD